jgi:hypothetical protein
MAHVPAREQVSLFCCGRRWVGVDRAHCCRRTAGCGHVFDDAAHRDRHRHRGRCLDPRSLDRIPTSTIRRWGPGTVRFSCDLLVLVDQPAEAVASLDVMDGDCGAFKKGS